MEGASICHFTPKMTNHTQVWVRHKSGAWNSIQVLQVAGTQVLGRLLLPLPGTLAYSCVRNRVAGT